MEPLLWSEDTESHLAGTMTLGGGRYVLGCHSGVSTVLDLDLYG